MLLKYIFVILILVNSLKAVVYDPSDLTKFSQDPQTYTENIKPLSKKLKKRLYKEFMLSYF